MKIALFTCFRPDTGGGAVNLRTLLAALPELDVTWFHLGAPVEIGVRTVSLGARAIGGNLIADLARSPTLWLGRSGVIETWARQIADGGFDRHWVVAMDEGVLVGRRLAEIAPAVPLHVSVHDDQEHGMFGRSRRYRFIARLTRGPVRQMLRAARSVDVTSDEMRAYYGEKLQLSSTVLHPVIDEVAEPATHGASARDAARLTLGHIGAIYSPREFSAALAAHVRVAATLRCKPAAVFVGLLPRYRPLVERAGIAAEFWDHLPEPAARRELSRADYLYAMYPFDRASRIFVTTSLPTKLSTYAQIARPLLAHAPADSTLARVVERYALGALCPHGDGPELERAIAQAAASAANLAGFARLRAEFYGRDNAERLRALLLPGKTA